jgi:murein DD-endopeptidase MepM/ murein hydrolase activator NlpD
MRVLSRIRMPAAASGLLAVPAAVLLDLPGWVRGSAMGLLLVALALYFRVGTPSGPAVSIDAPVRGRWIALNSPADRVPSHGTHAWAQTYAVDLVHDPGGGRHPGVAWWPLARRPADYPAFGQPVSAPVAGEVVRARRGMRDHWSRSSPPALLYFLAESVRELLGPVGVLGNHVVVRTEDGPCVLIAHLRRHTLRVVRGDRVEVGQVIAECGNSGNSTEPHVHIQAMDRPSVRIAAGLPLRLDGRELPANGQVLAVASDTGDDGRRRDR